MEKKKTIRVSKAISDTCRCREMIGRSCRNCIYDDIYNCRKFTKVLGYPAIEYIRTLYKNPNYEEEED